MFVTEYLWNDTYEESEIKDFVNGNNFISKPNNYCFYH